MKLWDSRHLRFAFIILVWVALIASTFGFRDSFAQSRWHFTISPIMAAAAFTFTRGRYAGGLLLGGTIFGLMFSLDLTTRLPAYYSAAVFASAVGFGAYLGMMVQAVKRGEKHTALRLTIVMLGAILVILFFMELRLEG